MQTIEQALRSPAVRAALASYHGVECQPTAHTAQCLQGLRAVIPLRSERSYTIDEIKERALTVVDGVYRSRADMPRLPEPETMRESLDRQRRAFEESLKPGYFSRGGRS